MYNNNNNRIRETLKDTTWLATDPSSTLYSNTHNYDNNRLRDKTPNLNDVRVSCVSTIETFRVVHKQVCIVAERLVVIRHWNIPREAGTQRISGRWRFWQHALDFSSWRCRVRRVVHLWTACLHRIRQREHPSFILFMHVNFLKWIWTPCCDKIRWDNNTAWIPISNIRRH